MKIGDFAISAQAFGKTQVVYIECPAVSHFDWTAVKEVILTLHLFRMPPPRVESSLSTALDLESCGLNDEDDFEFFEDAQTVFSDTTSLHSLDTTQLLPPSLTFIASTAANNSVRAATDDAKPKTPIEMMSFAQLTQENERISKQMLLAIVNNTPIDHLILEQETINKHMLPAYVSVASAAANNPALTNGHQTAAQPRVSLLDQVMRLSD